MADLSPTRTVVVTGGSRGLGLAISRRLAGSGYRVVAIARKAGPALEDLIANPRAGHIRFVAADLGDIDAIPPLVRGIRREFGPLWGLVNNAGIGPEGLLATMPNRRIEEVLRINTLSPLVLTKYVVRNMMADRGGRVINMSSIVASRGYSALSAYSASKAALVGFTQSLAREVGPLGVTVNAVAPGFVDTEMTKTIPEEERARLVRRNALRRLAEAEDVAAAVEFLLSEGARNITGTVMTVDAGGTV